MQSGKTSYSGRARAWIVGLAVSATCALPVPAAAQDYQNIGLGKGLRNSECVLPGSNNVLNSNPAGDDSVFGSKILSGANGICETPLGGDDVRPSNGVVFGFGVPNAPLILSATPGQNDNGICDDPIVPQGDDVVRISAGLSEPRMLEIGPGSDNTVQSVPGGDDVLTAVICPGPDGVFQSVADPADLHVAIHPLCDLCAESFGCIIPGADDILQTTPNAQDVLVPYISTGSDGIANSTAAGDDQQIIPLGKGYPGTVCVTTGPDGIAQTTLCGNGIADLEENGIFGDAECDDGNQTSGDGCSAICEPESICGNGIKEAGEQCDDGNTTDGDGCNSVCKREYCGDGIVQAALGEECDDGNSRNNDACVVGCKAARCGDGFLYRGVEECEPPNTASCDATCRTIASPKCGNGVVDPGEQCDDGNKSNRDDCLNDCTLARCGDGYVKSSGTAPFEECDDGNTAPGDGCSPTCTKECGNGVIDGACSEGQVGIHCSTNADCDTTSGAGDGVCKGEACDPGAAALCTLDTQICSNFCQIASCGNGQVECQEECDLGSLNGVAGSGCTSLCTRNVVGTDTPSGCASAWTLDSPPRSLLKRHQTCRDGDSCDFDTIPGQCTFRVGVCLNRPGVPGCEPGSLRSFDLRGLKVSAPQQAAAAESLTAAVVSLAQSSAQVPGRCRRGLRGKVCAIPDDHQCDSSFGAGDGVCDIGTGVLFEPPLDPQDLGGTQESICTSAVDIVVQAGTHLNLRSRTVWGSDTQHHHTDALHLHCRR